MTDLKEIARRIAAFVNSFSRDGGALLLPEKVTLEDLTSVCNILGVRPEIMVVPKVFVPQEEEEEELAADPDEEMVVVSRAVLEVACKEIREWKVDKGGDDFVVSNLEAAMGVWGR